MHEIIKVSPVMMSMASVFLLLFAGFAARRANVLKSSDADVIRAIVTSITGPAFVFDAVYSKIINRDMIIAPIIHLASLCIMLCIAYLVGRLLKLNRATTGGLMLASAFGNTGYLGYPVIFAAFPNNPMAKAAVVMVDQFGENMPMYSIGIAVALAFGGSKDGKTSPWDFLKTPLFISMVLALLLRTVPLPSVFLNAVKILAGATVPLAMISLGLSIARVPLNAVLLPFIAACVLKFAGMPLLNLAGLQIAGIHGTVRDVAMLEASMPTAVMASVIAGRYGANDAFVSAAVFLMTLMSAVIIPVTLLLFR